MSGFEVAGIVLGGFPILYEAAKTAKSRYRDLKWWWRFETEFEDFISVVDREFISFSLNQEILLSPLDILNSERDILQNDPNTLLWHDPRIQAQLRKRLGSRYYPWYMEQLHDINNAISKLLDLLPTRKACDVDPTGLESELFRLKWSFSHKKDKLLATIKDRNETIYAFLDRSAHLARGFESRRAGSRVWPYLSAQRQASSMYECLQSRWKCHCLSNHTCGIRASMVGQDRGDLEPKSFVFLFDEGERFTELRVEVAELKPIGITPQPSSQSIVNVSQLKEDISAKIRSHHARNRSSSLAALAASSLSIVGNPSNLGDGRGRLKWLERRFKKRVRLENSPTGSDKEPTLLDQPRVRFADVSNTVSDAHGEEIDILQLGAAPVSDPQNFKVESLEAYLDATPQRNQRLQVGLQLVQTVVTLGVTPWVPEKCTRMEVLLIRNLDSGDPTPYISHESVRSTFKGKQHVERSTQARASLFTIGVLLLELLFRKTLESLPLRDQYLGRVGVADYTADLCTAIQWQKQVEAEFGDRIADAIRRCVLCAFEPQPDLSDSTFIRALNNAVIFCRIRACIKITSV
ncbi:hypothetical protein NCS52_01507200 [Fusarium sp. LHS14.1]|nr:hypothetical protein NCS52_01507200 [Fusarium sp. LHS14.1]